MSDLLGSLLGALLPEPLRGAVVRRLGGDPARASGLLGLVEFVAGGFLLYDWTLAYLEGSAGQIASAFWVVADRRSISFDEALAATWSGAVVWLAWALSPLTWLLLSIPIVGLLRVVGYLTAREPIAEPALWAMVRAGQLATRLAAAARRRLRFGPADTPDEVEPAGATDLLIFSARRKPDWTPGVTLGNAGRFYRLASHATVRRPTGLRHLYRLTPQPEHEVIRRYVRYEVPRSRPSADSAESVD